MRKMKTTLLKLNSLKSAGFTLIEMMIVLAIIAAVMGLVGSNVIRKYDEARVTSTKIQIKQLATILADFRRVCGFYPTTEQGLDALVKKPAGRDCKNYDPQGFVNKVPQDAWSRDFIYESDGNKFKITSYGADGAPGGEGINKELTSDDLD
ncbi:MAG: type II secretion system major pseudopilin GspG [Bdellovibrionia bacterium]